MAKQKESYEGRLFDYLKNRFSPSLNLFEKEVWIKAIQDFEADEKRQTDLDKTAQAEGHADHDAKMKAQADADAVAILDEDGQSIYKDAADRYKKDQKSHTLGFENYGQQVVAEKAARIAKEKEALAGKKK